MQAIINEIKAIIKENVSFYAAEEGILQLFRETFVELVACTIDQLDKELVSTYTQNGWEIDRIEEKQLSFQFGEIRYRRRRLRKCGEKSMVPLDDVIELPKKERFSPKMIEMMVYLASSTTYRNAAEIMNLCTPINVSHQTVHNKVKAYSEKAKTFISNKISNDEQEKSSPTHLYIEGDGVLIGSKEKGKHIELHRIIVHEGVETISGRSRLISPITLVSFKSSEDVFRQLDQLLQAKYKLKNAMVITNSDGGKGYEPDRFKELFGPCVQHEHFTDPYHVNKKILERLGWAKHYIANLKVCLKAYDSFSVRNYLDSIKGELVSCDWDTSREIESVDRLQNYLDRNWEYIKPTELRAMGNIGGIGVCESTHRYFTYRMKRQGRAWSKKGATALVQFLSIRQNKWEKDFWEKAFKLEAIEETTEQTIQPKVRITSFLREKTRQSIGAKMATIPLNGASTSATGRLIRTIAR